MELCSTRERLWDKVSEEQQKSIFENDSFPVITISLSYDDPKEPIHVDLGSVPPFVAAAIFEQVIDIMEDLKVGPKVTFGGKVLIEAEGLYGDLELTFGDDEDDEEDD